VPSSTLRFIPLPDDAVMHTVEGIAMRHGARVTWEAPYGARRYALLDGACVEAGIEIAASARAKVFEGPVIALALSPSAPEALLTLADALGGGGAPSGIVGCEMEGSALVVEWDLERTPYELIETLIAVELQRYRASSVNALLTPLPLKWVTRLAAYALRAPEITPERVLEYQLEVQGVDA
jgi:hypothetical protein